MKKDSKDTTTDGQPQKGAEIKQGLPEKNNMTDSTKNAATQTPGLIQAAITCDDLFPSDGDNLTN